MEIAGKEKEMSRRALWITGTIVGAGLFLLLLFLSLGGLYTITQPSGPVDSAYKMNRLTGQVWLIKTYTKQVGELRVLAAREAAVEKTHQITDGNIPPVAMQ